MNVTSEQLTALKPLVVAVVGPTNEGKTSLLRTLTNDPNFGHVNAYTGTTARAEIQKVFYRGCAEILQLVDTPGFQTSSEILELTLNLPEVVEKNGDFDLNDVMRAIPQMDEDYRHDLRAWREVARCDVVILVASVVEDPSKSLLKNTLRLLRNVGKPTVVAYNNVKEDASPERRNFRDAWEETLRKNRFFLIQEYDAHRRSFENEIELFEKLAAVAREPLTQRVLRLEMQERRAQERRRLAESRRILAELALDIVAYREVESSKDASNYQAQSAELEEKLKEQVVKREHDAHTELLQTWGFHLGVLKREMLKVDDTASEADQLLGKDVKRHFGLGSGVGVAVGAGLGLVLDAASAGISMGAGLTLGMFLGGLFGGGSGLAYNTKYDAKHKILTARVDRVVADVVLARGIYLVRQLRERGKALEDAVQALVPCQVTSVENAAVAKLLNTAAKRDSYSKLNSPGTTFNDRDWRSLPGASVFAKPLPSREEAVEALAEALKQSIPDVDGA